MGEASKSEFAAYLQEKRNLTPGFNHSSMTWVSALVSGVRIWFDGFPPIRGVLSVVDVVMLIMLFVFYLISRMKFAMGRGH